MRISAVITFAVLSLFGRALADNVYIDDGLAHIIDDTRYCDDLIWVDRYTNNYPGTSLRILTGGEIGGFVYAYHHSHVTLDGASVGGGLWTHGASTATVERGTVSYGLAALENSSIDLHGGVIDDLVHAADESSFNMHGGDVYGILATKHGEFNLRGGTIATLLVTRENATVYVYGSGFEVTTTNGTLPLSYGDRLSDYGILANDSLNNYLTGTLSGILEDGTGINNVFNIYDTSDIVIVPEPISLLVLALGGAAVLRRKAVREKLGQESGTLKSRSTC